MFNIHSRSTNPSFFYVQSYTSSNPGRRYLENIKIYLQVDFIAKTRSKEQQREKKGNRQNSCMVALSRQHLLLSACLRCRTLLSGRPERTAARPISGSSAVLTVLRYCCGYRSVVMPSLRGVRRRKSDSKNKRDRKQRKTRRINMKSTDLSEKNHPPVGEKELRII